MKRTAPGHIKRYHRILRLLPAFFTLVLASALIWTVTGAYVEGVRLRAGGDALGWIFTRERLAARAWAVRASAAALALSSGLCAFLRARCGSPADRSRPERPPCQADPAGAGQAAGARPQRLIRLLLIAAGICGVIAGALNGGLLAVLTKAVNLCTECVGLG